jgi:outer membrane protein OmpA-like peptidoglycan-associated protein
MKYEHIFGVKSGIELAKEKRWNPLSDLMTGLKCCSCWWPFFLCYRLRWIRKGLRI